MNTSLTFTESVDVDSSTVRITILVGLRPFALCPLLLSAAYAFPPPLADTSAGADILAGWTGPHFLMRLQGWDHDTGLDRFPEKCLPAASTRANVLPFTL
jgi:hypothetical protein